MRKIFLLICVTCVLQSNAQTEFQRQQNVEYKRLSEATQRAFAIPDRPSSASAYQSSSSYNNSSSSSSNSGSNVSSVSFFEHNNYSWADYSNINRINKAKAKNEAANDARARIYDAKVAKVEECYKTIEKKRENYQRIMYCAVSKGLEYYDAMKIVGFDENDFWSRVSPYKSSGSTYFKGSTKSDCSGNCTETLDYNNGTAIYVGNTKNGTANGKGALTFTNGNIMSGEFYDGDIVGSIMIKYISGIIFEGENFVEGEPHKGKYTFTSGTISEGMFINNKLQGWGRVTNSTYTTTGYYKDNLPEKKGERLYEYKNGEKLIFDYDYPQNETSYKAIIENSDVRYEGIFKAKTKSLLAGKSTNKKTGEISESIFNNAGQKNGYRIDYLKNNKVNEAIYINDANAGPIRFTTITGAILIGITGYKDYDLYGLLKNIDGSITLGALQKGAWITLPETERENVMKVFNETNIALLKGRAAYEETIK
jgi:hypothetical protein